ncbi:bifunctional alpha/beta hydrolase/OsmC family protein [Catenulispora subtropica]|uniref:Bifunctional alpha/beta hydrolase/OsmC family protein n=1 Tax=Catenulispora subtropica TaxID=450798 RepID=A0ABN2SXC7_9ACTN
MSASQKITFTGSGGDALAARLELPAGPPRAYAVFAHCFTCGKDAFAAARIARALTGHGIAVLRFDFTGLGQSDGDFGNTGFSSNIQDLIAAADHLRTHHAAPSLLIGHSLGGAAVLAARVHIPEVRAVATIGAPADPAHVAHLIHQARAEIEREGQATVSLGGREFCIRRAFLEDIAAQSQNERIRDLKAALMVMHSPTDEVVGVDNARLIFDAAKHPKSFVSLDGADHLLTRRADAAYVASVLAAWVARYLPAQPAEAGQPAQLSELSDSSEPSEPSEPVDDVVLPQGVVRVSEAGGHYPQAVAAGTHRYIVDEPAPLGSDTGPSPYDLLLSALGGCTSITLRMYAERKGWPLRKVTVSLSHDRVHAKDCEQCETTEGHVDRIDRRLQLEGPLTADQRARLLQIADMCPVHRTLTGEVVIRTELL